MVDPLGLLSLSFQVSRKTLKVLGFVSGYVNNVLYSR